MVDTPDQSQELEEILIRIADGIFVDYCHMGFSSISLAAEAMREKTDDQRLIRKALSKSAYGSCQELNLRSTFELF